MKPTANALTLDSILAQFREDARNNRDLGDRFERMMLQFFRIDPVYDGLFEPVWRAVIGAAGSPARNALRLGRGRGKTSVTP